MHTTVLTVRTGARPVVADLTPDCRRFLREAGARDGLLSVFVPHATAGVAVLELGAGSDDDLLSALEDLLPFRFGPQSASVAQRFAAEKRLPLAGGSLDAVVYGAAWSLPVT